MRLKATNLGVDGRLRTQTEAYPLKTNLSVRSSGVEKSYHRTRPRDFRAVLFFYMIY